MKNYKNLLTYLLSSLKNIVPQCNGALVSSKKCTFTLAEVFSTNFAGQRKAAFTLAEVLITLGIIGVVAAMTLPTIMQKKTNIEVESKLKKIYATMNQAIMLSEIDNGPKEYWGYCNDAESCTLYWKKFILPYLKSVKQVEIPSSIGIYNIAIYFTDGTLLICKNEVNRVDYFFYPNAKNFSDDNFQKTSDSGENVREGVGTTYFAFSFAPDGASIHYKLHYKKGFEPFKISLDEVNTTTLKSGQWQCTKNGTNRCYCTALIQLNGWKIPDDYPLQVK